LLRARGSSSTMRVRIFICNFIVVGEPSERASHSFEGAEVKGMESDAFTPPAASFFKLNSNLSP
jgi:hypothetical protein